MRLTVRLASGITVAVLSGAALLPSTTVSGKERVGAPTLNREPIATSIRRLPLQFEINRGQAPHGVRFIAHLAHEQVQLRSTCIDLTLWTSGVTAHGEPPGLSHRFDEHSAKTSSRMRTPTPGSSRDTKTATVDLRPVGPNPNTHIVGLDRLPGRVNYLIGPSPSTWRTNIAVYARVAYRDIYPHIDLVFHGNNGQIEYDWVLHPGARISDVRMGISGGTPVMERDGSMAIHTRLGDIQQDRPAIYERIGHAVRPIRGGYVWRSSGTIGFWSAPQDSRRTLVIDPVLRYSTYLGGSGSDWGAGIVLNQQGDAYVMGSTVSPDYPLLHPLPAPGSSSQENTVVSKLNPAGTGLLFSTYLGGEGDDDGTAIALDSDRNVYVTGFTRSAGFPTVHPLPGSRCNQDQPKSGDVFVSELSPSGDSLLSSTCLGGSGVDWPAAIAVDTARAVYVAGSTTSDNFPTRDAYQDRRAGGTDAFVSKLLPGRLGFSTYLGGGSEDQSGGIAIDPSGSVTVAGTTHSDDFPTVKGLQSQFTGGNGGTGDVFVSRLTPRGQVIHSTLLGGHGDDQATGIATDPGGSVYVTGVTASSDFPTPGSSHSTPAGGTDAFVTKLSPGSADVEYTTFLGGDGSDAGSGIAVDGAGNAYVAGTTSSSNFPVLAPLEATVPDGYRYGDVFVARLDPAGKPTFATDLGGSGVDLASGIAVDGRGAAYVTGGTSSIDFPITSGLAGTSPDHGNAFIVKIETSGDEAQNGVAVDRLGLFQQRKNGSEVSTRVVRPGQRVLFTSLFHTVGVTAASVRATISLTAGHKSIATRKMSPGLSADRRPMFSVLWRAPSTVAGKVIARVKLSVGTVSVTKTLRFDVAARAQR